MHVDDVASNINICDGPTANSSGVRADASAFPTLNDSHSCLCRGQSARWHSVVQYADILQRAQTRSLTPAGGGLSHAEQNAVQSPRRRVIENMH